MKEFNSINEVEDKNYVVSVGMYDGVHLGHQRLIEKLKEKSQQLNLENLIVTFEIHPKTVLNANPPKLLMTKEDKKHYLEKLGVDNVLFLNFNKQISEMGAEKFVKRILVNKLNASAIIIGENHRFGNKQKGDYHFLKEIAGKYNFEVYKVPIVKFENKRISSTWVRKTVLEGKLRLTKELLNRFYFIKGYVESGSGRGKRLGYPTANIEGVETKLPLDGIYSSYVEYDSKRYPAMSYIGYAPTYEGEKRKVEVHIFDFNDNIYGEELKVYFVAKIRNEEYFSTEEDLKKKLMIDKNVTLSILADEDLLF
ncbi:MAG: bifunctional riboflavin kinase/FAD synthetase [Candidatus Mcinerneyibacterium aminivorans]|uniref:Riboflavin biosynthesis protein n=1 Tax=Candidatus Mcinerneyibacterium aminivorans TaxID=2703815 RepID=A0A5D0MJ82_9BACT|nr:MAG: bifunctional riboflavin kinase/FAD synthetase [Candidatus Mcinerneyibacterium aminivorans]